MSEQAPNLTPSAEPSPDQIDVETAFDPVAREAQAQMDIYTENRPDLNEAGVAVGPDGSVLPVPEGMNPDATQDEINQAAANAYFDEQHQIAKDHSQTVYEDMSIPALAHKLGEAEHYGDKTTEQSVTDVLLEKMGTEEARIATNQDGTETQARQDNLWDSVMAAKDLKKRQLEKKNGSQASIDGDTGEPGNGNVDGDGNQENDQDPAENGQTMLSGLENAEVPEGAEPFASGTNVLYGKRDREATGRLQYSRDKDGNLLTGEIYRGVGDVMKWSENDQAQGPNRRIIMHAYDESGKHVTWYVKGNRVYEIDQSRPSKTSTKTPERSIKIQDLQEGEDLPDMAIGQDLGNGLILQNVHVLGKRLPYVGNPAREEDMLRQVNPAGHSKLGKTASNPFDDIEKLIAPVNRGNNPDGGATPDNEPPTQPMPEANAEAGEERGNLEEQIKEFSDRFADKTYVPTLGEYEQMRELAGRIRIDYGEEDGNEPMRYLNVDGGQLNAKATRDFLDRVHPLKWQMKHRNADVAEDLYEHATPLNVRRLSLPQRNNRDLLSFRQFALERAPEQDQDGELPGEELTNQYKEYVKRRVDLNNMLTGRQAAYEMYGREAKDVIAADVEAGRDVVTANDIAMDALASFRRGISRDRQARRRNAADRLRNARPDRLARRAARRVRGRS